MPEPKIYSAQTQAAENLRWVTGKIANPPQFVKTVVQSDWWAKVCPNDTKSIRVDLVDDPGVGGIAYTESTRMVLGKMRVMCGRVAANDPWVICHELAHFLVPIEDPGYHGRQFVMAYIRTVRQWMGNAAADELTKACKDFSIRLNYRLIPTKT